MSDINDDVKRDEATSAAAEDLPNEDNKEEGEVTTDPSSVEGIERDSEEKKEEETDLEGEKKALEVSEKDDSPSSNEGGNADRRSGDEKEAKKKAANGVAFPKFLVFASPVKDPTAVITHPKRRTSGSSHSFLSNDPFRPPEMSPEITLIEFISTSASFHGVKKQDIKQLEWDILKVFTNNVMPANAAAWYMAKRRYYLHNAWENQLLPFLLKKYPDKFYVRNQSVEFLDVCTKDIARKKMNYMVNQGLFAYFSHKADEYGVYFFDPYYYEHTEPFHANLRIATNTHTGHRSKLLPTFFAQYKNSFVFTQHNPYLVTLSKAPTEVKINTTGIIVSMIDNAYGIIQFPSGAGTEKALFCAKSLFIDAWPYQGDPLKLDAIKFDGYRIPGPVPVGRDYTWYAVLVWGGRKPSPKFCATKDDLTSNRHFQHHLKQDLTSPIIKSPPKTANLDDSMIIGEIIEIRKNGAVVTMQSKDSQEKAFILGWRRENLRKKGYFLTTTQGVGLAIKDLVGYYIDPNQKIEPYAAVAHQIIVLKHADEIKAKLSPVEVEFGSPNTRNGILRQLANIRSNANTTVPASTIGRGAMAQVFKGVVTGPEMNTWKMLKKIDSSKYAEEEDENYTPGAELNIIEDAEDSSEYESFDEADDVSDGELNFLRDGIMDFISLENRGANDWRSITFLQKIMQETNNLINTRNLRRGVLKNNRRPVTHSSSHDSGHATSSEVSPSFESRGRKGDGSTGMNNKEAFWRMKKAFKCLNEYNSEEDPPYDPSDSSDGDEDFESKGNESKRKKQKERTQVRTRKSSFKRKGTGVYGDEMPLANQKISSLVANYWMTQILGPGIKFCQHEKKWIMDPKISPEDHDDDGDLDYKPPMSDIVDSESDIEISEDELNGLIEDSSKEVENVPLVQTEEEESDKDVKKRVKKPSLAYWARYLLEAESGSIDNKESPKEDEEKEEDQYDSESDPEYVPPPVISDVDGDYDEYSEDVSDSEISKLELEAIINEQKLPLTRELIGDCTCSVMSEDLTRGRPEAATETGSNETEEVTGMRTDLSTPSGSVLTSKIDASEIFDTDVEKTTQNSATDSIEMDNSKDKKSSKSGKSTPQRKSSPKKGKNGKNSPKSGETTPKTDQMTSKTDNQDTPKTNDQTKENDQNTPKAANDPNNPTSKEDENKKNETREKVQVGTELAPGHPPQMDGFVELKDCGIQSILSPALGDKNKSATSEQEHRESSFKSVGDKGQGDIKDSDDKDKQNLGGAGGGGGGGKSGQSTPFPKSDDKEKMGEGAKDEQDKNCDCPCHKEQKAGEEEVGMDKIKAATPGLGGFGDTKEPGKECCKCRKKEAQGEKEKNRTPGRDKGDKGFSNKAGEQQDQKKDHQKDHQI